MGTRAPRQDTHPDSPRAKAKQPDGTTTEVLPTSKGPIADPIELSLVPRSLYVMGKEFARGGLGRIIKARDTRLNRTVAIKELHFKNAATEARFLREVGVTARLQHPSIIPVHEAGQWPDGEPFYAMKLVEGRSLAEAIGACESFAERAGLVQAVVDVAEAIAYAHSEQIIHRDLKPANVLIGNFGETVVIDWGLAKNLATGDAVDISGMTPLPRPGRESSYKTTDGAVIGTPAYMPPEQARGDSVDATADVYALGAMLYHVIAGHMPYVDRQRLNIIEAVSDGPPTPLRDLVPEAPRDLIAIVEHAMARDPAERYPNAGAMAKELTAYTTGHLVGAYHYSLWELLRRLVRRQRAAAVITLIALAALTTFASVSVRRITIERDKAAASATAEAVARLQVEERLDELVLERAAALLDEDPTGAVAQLKDLKTIRPKAASIAADAEELGVAEQVLRGHRDQVEAIAFSPDGRQLVSASDDGSLIVWGDRPHRLRGHSDRVTAATFSPDGVHIASGSYDGTVRLWNTVTDEVRILQNGEPDERRAIRGGEVAVKAVAFSPDGARLASVSYDGNLRIWEDRSMPPRVFPLPVDRELFVTFSPDGRWLLSGSHGRSARLYSWRDDSWRVLPHRSPVTAGLFSPLGEVLATACRDGSVRVWPLAGGSPRTIVQQVGAATTLAFSPDGQRLASAGADGVIRLSHLGSGAVLRLEGHREGVLRVAFSPNGQTLASGGWDSDVVVHHLPGGTRRRLMGHEGPVSALTFSPDGARLATASWDKTVRIWPVRRNPGINRRLLARHIGGAKTVAISPDGRQVASGGHDNIVRLIDLASGEVRELSGHTDHVYRVIFSPKGRYLASSSDDRTVRVLELDTGTERVFTGHSADVEELAFSADGARLASASEDHTARLWDLASGESITLAHDAGVTGVAFSPGGDTLATISRDHRVRLWNPETGAAERSLAGHTAEVRDLAFRPDGALLATASVDGTVRLWTVASGEVRVLDGLGGASRLAFSPAGSRLAVAGLGPDLFICDLATDACEPITGHSGAVHDLLFSRNGRALVTAGDDDSVLLWDTTSWEHRRLRGHSLPIFDLDLTPDGTLLVSASADATVRLWPVVLPPPPKGLRAHLDALTAEISVD